jgi:uncharacterized protein YqeY
MGWKEPFREGLNSDVAKAPQLGCAGHLVNAANSQKADYAGRFPLTNGPQMIRDDIKAATIAAMKSGDKDSTGTLRLISAAIKNRDIELRTSDKAPDDDQLVTEVLQKMIKQRRESAEIYRKNGRDDRAATEESEIAVIERFLPTQMSDAQARGAILAIIADTGASSIKDMGKVMAEVKSRHAGELEPARASALVKEILSA